jgi:hypothetical protein
MALTCPLFAGWSEPIQLTHRGYEINPQIIAINDTLHLAWFQLADSQKVSYVQSLDGGQAWGEINNLSAWGHWGSWVNITKNQGNIFIGWCDIIPMEPLSVAFSLSENGLNWSQPVYISNTNQLIGTPISTTIHGDSIYLVYYGYNRDSTRNIPFVFLHSSDLGQTWSNEQTVAYALPDYCNGLIISKCFYHAPDEI